MKITKGLLAGACPDQLDLFCKTFPEGAEFTLDNCLKAVACGLDINWAAKHLLTAPALAAYQSARSTAWAAYQSAIAPAFAAYQSAIATAFYELAKCPKNMIGAK